MPVLHSHLGVGVCTPDLGVLERVERRLWCLLPEPPVTRSLATSFTWRLPGAEALPPLPSLWASGSLGVPLCPHLGTQPAIQEACTYLILLKTMSTSVTVTFLPSITWQSLHSLDQFLPCMSFPVALVSPCTANRRKASSRALSSGAAAAPSLAPSDSRESLLAALSFVGSPGDLGGVLLGALALLSAMLLGEKERERSCPSPVGLHRPLQLGACVQQAPRVAQGPWVPGAAPWHEGQPAAQEAAAGHECWSHSWRQPCPSQHQFPQSPSAVAGPWGCSSQLPGDLGPLSVMSQLAKGPLPSPWAISAGGTPQNDTLHHAQEGDVELTDHAATVSSGRSLLTLLT